MATFYCYFEDEETGCPLIDEITGLPLLDENSPITFTIPEFDPRFLGLRDPKYASEFTTNDAIDGIPGGGSWGQMTFEGNRSFYRENVRLELEKEEWIEFQEWFHEGNGDTLSFVWPSARDAQPVRAKFDRGRINVGFHGDKTGQHVILTFVLQCRDLEPHHYQGTP